MTYEEKMEEYNKMWDRFYSFAKEYYLKHGNLDVKGDYTTEDGYNLSIWLRNQKQAFNKGKLSEDKISKLEEIGFSFEPNRLRMKWDDVYKLVEDYYNKHGNLNMPFNFKAENGFNLYTWLRTQKIAYQEGKMDPSRARKLALLGFDFNNVLESLWDERYNTAKKYYLINGSLKAPDSFMLDDKVSLNSWIKNQMSAFYLNKISNYRKEKLEEIGVSFQRRKSPIYTWEEVYELAKKYYQEHGNFNVPRNYVTEDGYTLGRWLNTQKSSYKYGKLSSNRVALLEEIGVSFDTVNTRNSWDNLFLKAKAYYEEYGNLMALTNYVTEDGFELGVWLNKQRIHYKKGSLSDKRAKKLQEIGFNFDKKESAWLRMYKLVLQYYKENGNILIPQDYVTKEGYHLGAWLSEQKKLYWQGKLRENKKQKLDEINMTGIMDDVKGIKTVYEENEIYKHINFFIVSLCFKLGIDVIQNAEVLSRLSFEDFRNRLIVLSSRGIDFCDQEGRLHYIFALDNDRLFKNEDLALPKLALQKKLLKEKENH